MITDEQRASTVARFEQHHRAWESNEAVRTLYAEFYGRIAARLPDPAIGPFIEIGSGPGFARSFIPTLQLSDIVRAPWLDHEISAERLPFEDGTLGALVLFDVLHHLAAPALFFAEASRTLAIGGQLILCEPYLSPLSFPIYRWFHEEPVILGVDPLAQQIFDSSGGASDKDPFDGNQAIPTLTFDRRRGREALAARFPSLVLGRLERLAGPSYVASGAFRRPPLLPLNVWRAVHALEGALPSWLYRLIGFRLLVSMGKRRTAAT